MISFDPSKWYRTVRRTEPPAQGDQLFGISFYSVVPSQFEPGEHDLEEIVADVIVATQSCDLEQRKVARVEVIPFYPLGKWLSRNPSLLNHLEGIRQGHSANLYLLPGWQGSRLEAARPTRVVNFDEKLSVSWDEFDAFLPKPRLGLRSPYIEHFGQALARFYMRVGLPEDMPEISWSRSKAEPRTLTPDELAQGGLPKPAKEIHIHIQRLQLDGMDDVVFRASLRQDANYCGVGESEPEAIGSLVTHLARRRDGILSHMTKEGKEPHWLLALMPEA